MVRDMTPKEFAGRAASGPAPILLDVREPWELEIVRLEDAVHIPMGEIPSRFRELSPEADIVVMCRSGGRSAQVAWFLQQQGFQRVWNLAGGILAWADELDPSLPTY
jgi:rhodanese-related sulfurtransferase